MPLPTNPVKGSTGTSYGRVWVYDGAAWATTSGVISPGVKAVAFADLGSAADNAFQVRVVTYASGEIDPVYSDGNSWLRFSDNSVVA